MAEVLAQLASPVLGADGTSYRAQVVGGETPSGRWDGWVEFVPTAGGSPIRSPRETTQPNRTDAIYWASGLSAVYMEGALARALKQPVVWITPAGEPLFDAPAPDLVVLQRPPTL